MRSAKLKIDDVFISWFAQPTLNAVPSSLAVMFRREFLSRSRIMLELKRRSLRRAKRRNKLVAVTFNGAQHKPEEFLTSDGCSHSPDVLQYVTKFFKNAKTILLFPACWLHDAHYRRVPWIEVDAPKGLYVNLDGEPTHATHHRFDIEPKRLKLHLPESTELLSS